ncbi:hypothetical protein WDJ51_05455 [Rathayibacter sp. YIM 133350]|uniref:hypothetical protein n=1 Tax=Rathayibacter sp. YIM 133350 TaxID=3131992 RepID=UPI00307F5E90
MTSYLFDLSGDWIAFRHSAEGKYLFSPDGDWIGWFPWDDAEALTPDGDYLGTVVGDRLVQEIGHLRRGVPAYPGEPSFPGRPAFPGGASYLGSLGGYEDVWLAQRLSA